VRKEKGTGIATHLVVQDTRRPPLVVMKLEGLHRGKEGDVPEVWTGDGWSADGRPGTYSGKIDIAQVKRVYSSLTLSDGQAEAPHRRPLVGVRLMPLAR